MPRQSLSMTITPAQVNFHKETANLVCNLFRFCKLPSSMINNNSFWGLCQHLNPLVQLPSVEKIDSFMKSKESLVRQPCLICGNDDPNQRVISISSENAAIYLAVAVMSKKKRLQQAKRDILNESLMICVEHSPDLHNAMLKCIALSSATSFNSIPDYKFLSGSVVYNSIINMRRFFENKKVVEIEVKAYRSLVKEWLLLHTSNTEYQRVSAIFDNDTAQSDSQIAAHSDANSGHFQAVDPLPITTNTTNSESFDDRNTKEVKIEEVDLEKVKIEEPEFDEQVPSVQQHVPEQPTTNASPTPSLFPTKPTIYTLKNGKKVVKAPANLTKSALGNSSGKLVVHRVVKRKVFKRASHFNQPYLPLGSDL